MKIAVDAYGGDNAPYEIIKGCLLAVNELSADIVLVGKKDEINKIMQEQGIPSKTFEVADAPDILTMEDEPTSILKAKKDSSMGVAFRLVKDGICDAAVSAGNSGALLVGATMIVKRIRGIKRAALGFVFPTETGPLMLTDMGANAVCKPEYLEQFAMMACEYMKHMHNIKNPLVGLLNNGTESHKGTPLQQDTYKLLTNSNLNFKGNVEARDLALGGCDVIITDGFTGNIALKTFEGVSKMMSNGIKNIFKKNIITKLGAVLVLKQLNAFKSKYDYKEYGGAPLLGISKPIIKAHGSSDARAIKNAIRQAMAYHNSHMIDIITDKLSKTDSNIDS